MRLLAEVEDVEPVVTPAEAGSSWKPISMRGWADAMTGKTAVAASTGSGNEE